MRWIATFILALCVPALAAQQKDQLFTATRQQLDATKVLLAQETAWNQGDLDAFATCYKNSPDILFIGHTISRGYAQMLASYKTGYPTREKMGTLSFSRLETQPLDASFATVTGHFHLERSAAGGGNADGYFLLVVEKTSSGWKIVRDDTTALPPPQSK